MYEFEVWQSGSVQASVSGRDRDSALADAMHYAFVYSQDGGVQVREVIGKRRELIAMISRNHTQRTSNAA